MPSKLELRRELERVEGRLVYQRLESMTLRGQLEKARARASRRRWPWYRRLWLAVRAKGRKR